MRAGVGLGLRLCSPGRADRKGRPVFATCLEYQLEGKEYQVQLDDQVAEADQQPLGTAVQLLCSREDPTQCMLAEFPKRKGWFCNRKSRIFQLIKCEFFPNGIDTVRWGIL